MSELISSTEIKSGIIGSEQSSLHCLHHNSQKLGHSQSHHLGAS